MDLEATGEVWYWRGPAPFHWVTVPDGPSVELAAVSPLISYGWGCLRVTGRIGRTTWTTSLLPKDGLYVVPLKDAVRRAEGVELGDEVRVHLHVDVR